jgi:predicted kinase
VDARPRLDADARSRLIAITGRPATGKTTLATALAARSGLPLLSRDAFKEAAFDVLGWSDPDWSQRVGRLGYDLLRHTIDLLLHGGGRFLVDTTLTETAADGINQVLDAHGAEALQVLLTAPGKVRLERMRARLAAGDRHPGHADDQRLADPGVIHRIRHSPPSYPRLRGRLLVVDTTAAGDPLAEVVAGRLRI